ncbi:MAG: pyrroline-5-carboxylate reductase [Planctomycetota bacterium]|nr:pyrroline-5-carboxylate reductase [Planctomycetota bacterium]
MNNEIQIGFLGCGNMGGAILEGMLAEGLHAPSQVLVCEQSEERRRQWSKAGVNTTEKAEELSEVGTIVLAVKPQAFDAAISRLGGLGQSSLVISVMAGIASDQIREAMHSMARVVRVMPNTPCSIGMGISAIARGVGSSEADLEEACRLMSTVGSVVTIEEESMHAVTATSGSGPAYLFHLAEAWIAAGIESGLSPEISEKLVIETIHGSAELLRRRADPQLLRKMVTSPGGTTAAGIEQLEAHGVRNAVRNAVLAAKARGIELGRKDS